MDLFSVEARRNPYPIYDQLRAKSPVLEVPSWRAWLVFNYEDVRSVLNDPETFSSALGPDWLVFNDPPRHTKLRALISRAFTPGAVAALERRVGELANELLDQNATSGEMDLAAGFSIPLPMMVIAEMIGIPLEDRARFTRWSDVMLGLSHDLTGGAQGSKAIGDFRAMTGEMAVYLEQMTAARREAPRDDLLTRLVDAEVDGERLNSSEILGFVQLLLVGGQETTTNLLNNAMLCFMEFPDVLARAASNPDLLPQAIEEVLRYRSPFQWTPRVAKREAALHGLTIPQGSRVIAFMGAANRDPQQFPEPYLFDIDRQPNRHVAFGHGVHHCLGAPLTRLEARVALTVLLKRFTGFEQMERDWTPRRALHVHGPESLRVRFTARGLTDRSPRRSHC